MFQGRRNVLLLATSQALMLSAIVLAVAIARSSVTSLPRARPRDPAIALLVIGTAITSIPASAIMRWRGRPRRFPGRHLVRNCRQRAVCPGRSSPVVRHVCRRAPAAGRPTRGSPATTVCSRRSHRSRPRQPRHLAGRGRGIVAAFLGPQLALWGRDWVAAQPFVGSYLAQGALSVLGLLLLTRLDMRRPTAAAGGMARPLRTILAQPASRVAILGAAVAAPS